jgi:hypothetical protein
MKGMNQMENVKPKKVMVNVVTVEKISKAEIKTREINIEANGDQKWLASHCRWAAKQGHAVRVEPVNA